MKITILALGVFQLLLCLRECVEGVKTIDLTHELAEGIPVFPGMMKFQLTKLRELEGINVWIALNNFCTGEHVGTHMDAPYHFNQHGWYINDIPPERFIASAVVVDISAKAENDSNAAVLVEDLEAWEEANGPIPDGSVVLMYSGWERYWNDTEKYFGNAINDLASYAYPGFSGEAASWLVTNRKIFGVGTDTVSIDVANSTDFPAHVILAQHNLFNLENLANLDKLPAKGATLYAFPANIRDGTGAPTRVIATISDMQ